MNMFIVLLASLALTTAAPCEDRVQGRAQELASVRALPALEHEEVHDEFGQYALRYVTAEGTVVSERGRLVPDECNNYVLVTEGEISYISDDGNVYVTKFTAGLDGTHVEGNHIPVAPVAAVPESVVSEDPNLDSAYAI